MSITITKSPGETSMTLTPISGTLKLGGGHDDRGGGTLPHYRAGIARNGSFDVMLDSNDLTYAQALALVSAPGETAEVTGDAVSSSALIDVEISGDSVQIASISFKGTTAAS